VDKSQYDICLEVLKRLDDSGVLSKIILIGSWCLPLYRDLYFCDREISALRTRDIDFLVSRETKFNNKVDLPVLLDCVLIIWMSQNWLVYLRAFLKNNKKG
jgi:hypothetical protein